MLQPTVLNNEVSSASNYSINLQCKKYMIQMKHNSIVSKVLQKAVTHYL